MSKFNNAQRVFHYAVQENIGILAAMLAAKQLLNLTLTVEEKNEAHDLYNAFKNANWKEAELERRRQMYDVRWVD